MMIVCIRFISYLFHRYFHAYMQVLSYMLNYAIETIEKGALRAAGWRIKVKCHPFSSGRYDPVS